MIVSVVPDVSGIDKIFDYLVPDELTGSALPGSRVRVGLNGRRVGGWIVKIQPDGVDTSHSVAEHKLQPILAVSGPSVEPGLLPLTRWVARTHFGSWRAVLSQASAPRVRARVAHARRGVNRSDSDEVIAGMLDEIPGGGLVVVPPGASSLAVVAELARRGSTLVVCPTQKMAALGAAWLRGRGLTVAVVPEDWESARAGVDVVIGARSAVFAPCADLASICVIDEHDESLHGERAPTWHAATVARERAAAAGVPCIMTSPVPSARARFDHGERTRIVRPERPWPNITVVDLADVPVAGSLLSSSMLDALSGRRGSAVCVLNTKGNARVLVCKSCRASQKCPTCGSLLSRDDDESLRCGRCLESHGSVCLVCGRSAFVVPRGGVGQLIGQLRASVGGSIIEVVGDGDDSWDSGSVFVGTEAVLHRVPRADVAVFADIDRDLFAPRITAPREVLALVARAARMVGAGGEVLIQTREPNNPVLEALCDPDPTEAILRWCDADIEQRRVFGFPPFTHVARVGTKEPVDATKWPDLGPVEVAHFDDHAMLKARSFAELESAVASCRVAFGAALRVHADPVRY